MDPRHLTPGSQQVHLRIKVLLPVWCFSLLLWRTNPVCCCSLTVKTPTVISLKRLLLTRSEHLLQRTYDPKSDINPKSVIFDPVCVDRSWGNSAAVVSLRTVTLLTLSMRNEMNGRSASQPTRKWRTHLRQLYRARCALTGQWDAARVGACSLTAGTFSAPGSCSARVSACARSRVSSPRPSGSKPRCC